ncbi:hypothetical protein D9M72_480590 [compost metagenome]
MHPRILCLVGKHAPRSQLGIGVLEIIGIRSRIIRRRIGELRNEPVDLILEELAVLDVVANDVAISERCAAALPELADRQDARAIAASDEMTVAGGEHSIQAGLRSVFGRVDAIALVSLFGTAAGERNVLVADVGLFLPEVDDGQQRLVIVEPIAEFVEAEVPGDDDCRVARPLPRVRIIRILRRISKIPAVCSISLD